MTREDVIRMAREAGAWNLIDHDGIAALERFAALVAAHERDECAKLADSLGWVSVDDIRARGKK